MCLNCDFLADVSGLDNMATHLSQHETHTCQVVVEKGTCIYNCVTLVFDIYFSSFGQPPDGVFMKSVFSSYFICYFKYKTFFLISVSVCVPTSEHLSE